MMKKQFILVALFPLVGMTSCEKFLDEKPDIKLVVPKSLDDADLLLNDYSTMNDNYPLYGELGNDDYFLTKELWEAASDIDQRNSYVWADVPYEDVSQWRNPYKAVYNANQVLEILSKTTANNKDKRFQRISGEAHFFRAFAFQFLIEIYCVAYQAGTAADEYGIPLRLDPAIDETSSRASLKDSYNQVIKDYKTAATSLPEQNEFVGRPFKASAYAGLSRAYLSMGDYAQAYAYADSCLLLYSDLLDFNTLDSSKSLPIARFNKEVLFPALSKYTGIMNAEYCFVDTVLHRTYTKDDWRKTVLFEASNELEGAFHFKGNYDNATGNLFVGLTTSEVFLNKAESAVRIGKVSEALSAMNQLLKTRWKTGTFSEWSETNTERLLTMILAERRKELVFRGRRWADLKRLNLNPRFQKTLVRKLGNKEYELAPNSPKYAYRLSEIVINLSGIPQNRR